MKSFQSLLQKMTKELPQFSKKVLPFSFERKGIWTSEGFAVCALSSIFGIRDLIESGVLRGRSTEIFARYGLDILSVDKSWNKSMRRFDSFSNVEIKIADSTKVLPKLVKERRKIGVFIDGPKGDMACGLARRMFRLDNVLFVGIHDQNPKHLMNKYFSHVIYTDEDCFRKAFGHLDEEEQNTPMPDKLPDPAGPAIGFVIKEHLWRK